MVRYLFYTIGDLTYQSPLVESCDSEGWGWGESTDNRKKIKYRGILRGVCNFDSSAWREYPLSYWFSV